MVGMSMGLIKIFAVLLFCFQCVNTYHQNEDFTEGTLRIQSRFEVLKQNFIAIKSKVKNAEHGLDEKNKVLEKTISDFTLKFKEDFQLLKEKFNKHYAKKERKKLKELLRDSEDSVKSSVDVKKDHEARERQDQTTADIYDALEYGVVFRASTTTKTTFEEGEETIIFSHIHYDIGQGYDSNTGVFRAPRKGTYLFTTQFYLEHYTSLDVGLFVNDDSVALATLAPGNDACQSFQAITNLEEGDSVRVKHISSMGEHKLRQVNYSNSFSGVMIR